MQKTVYWVEMGLFILMVAIFAIFFALMAPELMCSADGSRLSCAKEWIGALSGWAAAGAAAITIRVLLDQAGHSKRQTDFVVGDAQPSFTLLDQSSRWFHSGATLRIENINRRAIAVTGLKPADDTFQLGLETIIDPTAGNGRIPVARFYGPTIEGWTDRAQRPPRGSIEFEVIAGIPPRGPMVMPLRLLVTYRLLGELHEERTALVENPNAEVNRLPLPGDF